MAEPLAPDFLEILRCPRCIHDDTGPLQGNERGMLEQTGTGEDTAWLVCQQCGLRYPITDGFPVMLEAEASPPEDGPDPRQTKPQEKA